MCAVLLPPDDNPVAVNKYIISYQIYWNMQMALQRLCISVRLFDFMNLISHEISRHIIAPNICSTITVLSLPSYIQTAKKKYTHKLCYWHNKDVAMRQAFNITLQIFQTD
jgi:hypothetical protein